MMNLIPNFDVRNQREYPGYEDAPIAKSNISTGQRIVRCFNWKVIFGAAWALLLIWLFFEKPFVSSMNGNVLGDWLFFAGGLILVLSDGVMRQKRKTTNRTPLWLRVLSIITILVAALLAVHFLSTNNFFFSLCEGGLAGSGICYAIAAYRSKWATFS